MQIWCRGDSTEQPPCVRSTPSVPLSPPPSPSPHLCFFCVTQAAVAVWWVWMKLYQSQRSNVTVSSIKPVFLHSTIILELEAWGVGGGVAQGYVYISMFKLFHPPDFSCYFFSFQPGSRSHSLPVAEILVINWGSARQMDLSWGTNSTSICQRRYCGLVAAHQPTCRVQDRPG